MRRAYADEAAATTDAPAPTTVTSVTGSDNAQAATPLTGSTEFGVPIGLGLSIPITNGVSVGAELTYHRFFGESFSADEEFGGGDLTTMNAVVRGRL